jgi:polar amino acid transport system substrate-binding protein
MWVATLLRLGPHHGISAHNSDGSGAKTWLRRPLIEPMSFGAHDRATAMWRSPAVKVTRSSILTLAVAAGLLAACSTAGSSPSAAPSTAASVAPSASASAAPSIPAPTSLITAGQLVDCVDIEYPPLEYFPTADVTDPNAAVGFDVDGAKAVATLLGLQITIRNTAFDALIPDLTAGRCDIVWSGLFVSAKRTAVADVTPYMATGQVVMVPVGNPKGIHAAGDLCGKPVSIQSAGLVEQLINAASTDCTTAGKPTINIQGYPKVPDELQQIILGRVDAVWETQEAVADFMSKNPGKYEVAFASSRDNTYGVYYQKGKADIGVAFAAALLALKNDGTLAGIATKYNLNPATLDSIK